MENPNKNRTKSSKSKLDWDVWYGIRKHQFLCGCFDGDVYLEALAQGNHGYPWINRSSPLLNDNKNHVFKNCITYFCPFKTLALHVTRIGCCIVQMSSRSSQPELSVCRDVNFLWWGWIQFMSSRLKSLKMIQVKWSLSSVPTSMIYPCSSGFVPPLGGRAMSTSGN